MARKQTAPKKGVELKAPKVGGFKHGSTQPEKAAPQIVRQLAVHRKRFEAAGFRVESLSEGEIPIDGAPCSLNTPTNCEYGDHFDSRCNTLAGCRYNQVDGPENSWWLVTEQATSCAEPSNPPGCPADYSEVPDGSTCTETDLNCGYAQGTCGCVQEYRDTFFASPQWVCVPLEPGCPSTRPALGSPCPDDIEGTFLACDYGRCFYGGRLSVGCSPGRHWVETSVECQMAPINPP